jgi:hypothetical protein
MRQRYWLGFSSGNWRREKGLSASGAETPVPRTIVEPNRMPPVNLNNSDIRERKDYAASEWKRMLASQS